MRGGSLLRRIVQARAVHARGNRAAARGAVVSRAVARDNGSRLMIRPKEESRPDRPADWGGQRERLWPRALGGRLRGHFTNAMNVNLFLKRSCYSRCMVEAPRRGRRNSASCPSGSVRWKKRSPHSASRGAARGGRTPCAARMVRIAQTPAYLRSTSLLTKDHHPDQSPSSRPPARRN
jgi:hypothetical protein